MALIVSHGQPSVPGPAAAANRALADRVAAHLPGWQVAGPTLAEPGALAGAIARMGQGARRLVYPMFMAEGWFTRTHLPARLLDAGGAGWRVLAPFGCDPAVQDLAVRLLAEAGVGAGDQVLVAAHGSFRSPAPAQVAQQVAALVAGRLGLARCEAAFIDQSPRLAEVAGFSPGAICLPFFAAGGDHVTDDLPGALELAGFRGRVLSPLGQDGRVPALIAASLLRAAQEVPGG